VTRASALVLAVAAVLAALSILLLARRRSEAVYVETANPTATPTEQDLEAPVDRTGRKPLAQLGEPPASRRIRMLVLDEVGEPVAGAALVDASEPSRQIDDGAAECFGSSDRAGVILIEPRALEHALDLAVVSESYLPSFLRRKDIVAFEHTVVLSPGHQQRVHCVDIEGKPLGRLHFLLSGVALPDSSYPSLRIPGIGVDAIHSSHTNADGVARFEGLPGGAYTLRLESDEYSILQGFPAGAIQVPGPEIDLVLGELVCGVFRIEEDVALAHRVLMGGDLRLLGLAQDDVGLLREKLEGLYPADIVVAAVRASGSRSTVQLRVLLRDAGIQDFEAVLQPERELRPPETLSVRHRNESCESFTLVALDDLAREISITEFEVLLGRDFVDGVLVPFDSGKESWLPRGEYQVRHGNPWVDAAIRSSRTMDVPGSLVLQLDKSFRRCRFLVADPGGAPVQPATLGLRGHGVQRTFTLLAPEHSLWLPVGAIEADVGVQGYALKTFSLAIDEGPDEKRIELRPDALERR